MTSSSIGKASTSVGPSPPRKRRLSSAMAGSSTNSIDISTSPPTPSASSTSRANRTQRRVSTSTSDCSSAAKTSTLTASPGSLCFRGLVGVDDVLDNAVAHDVAAGEEHELEAVDAREDALETDEAAVAGDIDLGDVAGDHRSRPEADPGEEHLHLRRRGVLG